TRIGGVRNDMPDRFEEETLKQVSVLEAKLDEYEAMMDDNEMILMRTMDVGVLKPDDAIDLGVTGPNLRASGVPYDLRRHDPYLVYDKLDFAICIETEGDCYARYRVRMNEMKESMNIIRQALRDIPPGDIMARKVPKRAPKNSEVFTRTADPRGDSSMHVIGNGTDKPYRVKIKSPAFINISAAPSFLIGYRVADVPAIMGSIDVCIGETDR
ncbi:MAG: NADH-quinone oxidoreductase subunit NuoD, partial [Thermoplasmata archaeon]|nr:NADH-quinone oxidoreductase subunit NuoD [Thermoplasmata archaeon]